MRVLFIALLVYTGSLLEAQIYGVSEPITCWSRDTVENIVVPPPASVVDGSAQAQTQFVLRFTDTFPDEARASVRMAAEIWGNYLQSDVPIRVSLDWRDQGDERILASAGPSTLSRAFEGAVDPQVWYPISLAEAIVGQELNDTANADINVVVNSTANWNFATEGRVPRNRIDLSSVILHELGHGLGFLSSIDSTSDTTVSIGFDERFIIYDLFLETPPGRSLVDATEFPSPSSELLAAVINRLDFAGETAVAKNEGELVPLFAPETFDVGSSVSHLDERVYPAGSEDALMTPSIASGEAIRKPGPVTLGVLFDLGWPLRFDLTSSLHEVIADRLAIYPNPASGSFTLETEDTYGPTFALLYAADGRQVKRQSIDLSDGQAQVDLTNLSPGLYTVLVPTTGQLAYTGRVVVR